MRSDDLTRDEAEALTNKLVPMFDYLNRFKKRMTFKGFTNHDELLYTKVWEKNLNCGLMVAYRRRA